MIDITMIGDKQAVREFNKLPGVVAKKIMRKALRNSIKRLKPEVVRRATAISSKLGKGMRKMRVRSQKARAWNMIRIGLAWPTRADLGIPAHHKGFYPTAIEYGHTDHRSGKTVAPRPFVRPAVNEKTNSERIAIGRDLRTGIARLNRKHPE